MVQNVLSKQHLGALPMQDQRKPHSRQTQTETYQEAFSFVLNCLCFFRVPHCLAALIMPLRYSFMALKHKCNDFLTEIMNLNFVPERRGGTKRCDATVETMFLVSFIE